MAEENTPKPQRPIGIKPITIKPMQAADKPKTADADKPDETAGSQQGPKAASPTPDKSAEAKQPASTDTQTPPPGIKPITIKPNTGGGATLSNASSAPTIRLKPVAHPPSSDDKKSATVPLQQTRPPTIQPPSIKPSTHPLPDSAAKSKTSRISLDSALGDTGSLPGPSSAAPVGKITSHINTDAASPEKSQTSRVNLPLTAGEGEVTRRRTLRVKSPAGGTPAKPSGGGEPLTEAPTVKKKKAIVLKKDVAAPADQSADADDEDHVSAFAAFKAQPVEKTNPVFPVLAVASIFMIVALTVLYMSQACGPDRSLTAFSSFPGVSAPSWPGQVNTY